MCIRDRPTDIHTGACTHMFHVAQVADVVVSVLYCIVVVLSLIHIFSEVAVWICLAR